MNIETDNNDNKFILTGDLEPFLQDKRMRLSFSRLNFEIVDNRIEIPFETETKINTLQEIQALLKKFQISDNLSQDTKKDVESYSRELENFKEFSEKAKDIRNNNFSDKPELVESFNEFQKVLKTKLVRDLYPLQLLSAFHMAFAQNSCNFAVPGAGKTSIVYGAYAYLKNLPSEDPRHVDNLLVIGPLSSFAPWEKEYEKNFGVKPEVQRLSGDSSISIRQKEQHLYSTSPAELTLLFTGGVHNLKKEIIDFLKRNKTMVVVDEAHRIKNPDGIWGKSSVEISKEAISRVILTGTPVPNGYEDLFNLYQFLYPYKYKDILQFHFDNLVDMTKNSSSANPRVKQFTENISPYFIRIKKKDLDLPPSENHLVRFDMSEKQRTIYDYIETRYVRDFEDDSNGSIKNLLNKAKLIRLRQASTNPSLLLKPILETLSPEEYDSFDGQISKLPNEFQDDSEILSDIINYSKTETPQKYVEVEKIFNDHIKPKDGKVIVWTIFIQNAKNLQEYLHSNNIKSKLLIGEVEQSEREAIIDKFNDPNNEEFQVVIANPFSVAESISLHDGCHNAIYMERDYNCSNFLQSKDRIHRKGLAPNQETHYYYVIARDSIDEVIDEQLNIKAKRMEEIIDQDIPLFARIHDDDETDLITALLKDYARRA